jgi:class 3 adenylate cyclase
VTKTVVELDLAGYSTICDSLEQSLDASSVAQLNQQIRSFIEAGLKAVSAQWEGTVMATAGDSAILVFDSAQDAHRFTQAVHEETRAHNLSRNHPLAKRIFRSGAATGEIVMQPKPGGGFDIAGMTIARAKRLEAQSAPGGLLIDEATYEGLSDDQKSRYGAKTVVPGKRDEEFEARLCQMNADGPKDAALFTARVRGEQKRFSLESAGSLSQALQLRPRLILERANVWPIHLVELTDWDTKRTITVSGEVTRSDRERRDVRERQAQVARVLIRNQPNGLAPSAIARGVNARIRFINQEGKVVCDVPKGRWTEAAANQFPDSRLGQSKVDFGIGEAQWLDIAFKYDDSIVPYALDDRAVTTPKWELPENMLWPGSHFITVIQLSGEWVETELRCELLIVRADEGQPGHLQFHPLDAIASGSAVPLSETGFDERAVARDACTRLVRATASACESLLNSPSRQSVSALDEQFEPLFKFSETQGHLLDAAIQAELRRGVDSLAELLEETALGVDPADLRWREMAHRFLHAAKRIAAV